MKWSDLFNPDKLIAAAFKVFLVVLAFLLAVQWLLAVLSRLSAGDIAVLLLCWVVVSYVAFRIRELRRGHNLHPRNQRGAERTPLFPRWRN